MTSRGRDPRTYTAYEWKEWRQFLPIFEKILRDKIPYKTIFNLNWDLLQSNHISRAECTPEEAQNLSDTLPFVSQDLIVTTNDGVSLAVYLKGGLLRPWKEELHAHLLQETVDAIKVLENSYTPPPPKRMDIRHAKHQEERDKYAAKNYGVYHFCLWKSQGHPHEDAKISQDTIANSRKFSATDTFFRRIAPLIQTIGLLFEGIDPLCYRAYLANYEDYLQRSPLRLLQVSNHACFLGLALLRNLRVRPHKDTGDVKDGWAVMCCWGDFEGGALVLPELGMQFDYKMGDVIFFRSSVLEHFVAPFKGDRSAIVFFTKKHTWKEFQQCENSESPES